MEFTCTPLEIPGVLCIGHEIAHDPRGFFQETFRKDVFGQFNIPEMVQDNCSRSKQNVLRGLHYQLEPCAVGKLVQCVSGTIFDVAVDLRKRSGHFGAWVGVTLSDDNQKMLYVPPGCAHGFCVLSKQADVFYKMTGYFSPTHDRSVLWNDKTIGIKWPIDSPIVSQKDANAPTLQNAENNFSM